MSIRRYVDRLIKRGDLYDIAVRVMGIFWRVLGAITWRNKRVLDRYLRTHEVHCLQLGCGTNYPAGWFNTDIHPDRRRTRLDATRRFPFADETFDYIFSEHMIEHIPYAMGHSMLSECFRVLKIGGKLRIVTPDLRFLWALYQDPEIKLHQDYIRWSSDLFIGDAAPHNAVSVMNNYFRDWGHQYIYDFPVLSDTLKGIGFGEITKLTIGESPEPVLSGLELDERMPDGFLALESMILEARKPVGSRAAGTSRPE